MCGIIEGMKDADGYRNLDKNEIYFFGEFSHEAGRDDDPLTHTYVELRSTQPEGEYPQYMEYDKQYGDWMETGEYADWVWELTVGDMHNVIMQNVPKRYTKSNVSMKDLRDFIAYGEDNLK